FILHDDEPMIIHLAHYRTKRFFRDELRENHVVIRIGDAQSFGIKGRGVGGIGVAAASIVSLHRLVGGGESYGLELHLMGTEIIREIELSRSALLHTNRRAIEFERRVSF